MNKVRKKRGRPSLWGGRLKVTTRRAHGSEHKQYRRDYRRENPKGNTPSICPVLWTLANGIWFKRAAGHTLNLKIYQNKPFVRRNVINLYQESRRTT